MTVKTKEYKVYTIESHPNPEKCFDWIRNNIHDLGDWDIQEVAASLEAFASHIGAKVDYSISIVPDRGENISFDFGCNEPTLKELDMTTILNGECPFTGTWADEVILDAFRDEGNANLKECLDDVEYRVLRILHSQGEYLYSDEGLYDLAEGNDYEFNIEGELD